MRRLFTPLGLAAAVASVVAAQGAAAAPESSAAPSHRGGGGGYFAVVCGFSHMNMDDPIVFPGQPGRSHHHTYFGARSTDAFSTPASLREDGRTTCRLRADTAAYWAPTLNVGGQAVEPLAVVAYYIRRTFDAVDPFPAGLKVIAGDATARTAQSSRVTFWSCAVRGAERSSTIPTCPGTRRGGLRLYVNFPNCWNGQSLDSANHKSHMAYSSNGACPSLHPIEVPALSLIIYYGVSGGPSSELASGGQFSAHADFVNSWRPLSQPVALRQARVAPLGARGRARSRGASSVRERSLTQRFLSSFLSPIRGSHCIVATMDEARTTSSWQPEAGAAESDEELRFADLVLNEATRDVRRAGTRVDLTPTEFNLLRFFLLNPRRVLTKQQILDGVWDEDFGGDPSIVETYVSYLRRKLDPFGPSLIHTVRLVGYAMREADA